jgi:hypothetical protein
VLQLVADSGDSTGDAFLPRIRYTRKSLSVVQICAPGICSAMSRRLASATLVGRSENFSSKSAIRPSEGGRAKGNESAPRRIISKSPFLAHGEGDIR